MSNGSNTVWHYARQSAYEVIPTTLSTWHKYRFNGGGPARATSTEEDPEIGGSAASVTSEAAATGTFDLSMWYGQLENDMEEIMGAEFVADALNPGSTIYYSTFQEEQPDLLAGNTFTQFENGSTTSLTLTFPTPNGRITAQSTKSFSNGASSATTIVEASPTVNTSPVMRTGGLVTALQIDDATVASLNLRISNLTLTLTRETADEPQIDVEGRGAITLGDLNAELSMTVYDEDRTILNTMFQNVSRKIEWQVVDTNGQGYSFLMPSATPNGGEASAPAKNTGRTQTLPFKTADLTITRIP